jgi:hypothetical protein
MTSQSPAEAYVGSRFSVVRIGEAGNVPTPCERVVALCRRLERSHTASGSLSWP